MVADQIPNKESKRQRGKGDMIKLIDLKLNRRQILGFQKGRRKQDIQKVQVLKMNNDFWDRICGLGSELWKTCEWVELLLVPLCLRETGITFQVS